MTETSTNKQSNHIYLILYNKLTQTLIIKFNYNQHSNVIHKINNIEIKLDIPKNNCLNEIMYRLSYEFENSYMDSQLIKHNNSLKKSLIYLKHFLILSYEFKNDLKTFISNLNQIYYDHLNNELLDRIKNNATTKNCEIKLTHNHKFIAKRNDIRSYWIRFRSKLSKNTNETSKKLKNFHDSLSFFLNEEDPDHLAKIYHNLIHSELMPKILKLEHLFMIEYNDLTKERDKYLRFIQEVHLTNLNEKLKPENGYSDSYISKLAMVNIEEYELEKNKWNTRIDTLKNLQQRKFRKYITKLYELKYKKDLNVRSISKVKSDILIDDDDLNMMFDDQLSIDNNNILKFKPIQIPTESAIISQRSNSISSSYLTYKKIEESYTIQLGAQLKSMHNLRLIRCDILDYCKFRFKAVNINSNSQTEFLLNQMEPHSIQTAMSLYSNKLCAVVLLIDCFVDSSKFNNNLNLRNFSSQSDESSLSIKNSSEFNISIKLNEICNTNGCEFHFFSNEQQILMASKIVKSVNNRVEKDENDEILRLNVGDFYLTKHSNLSQAHIIFHLATNDSSSIDINNSNETENSDNLKLLVNQSLKNSELSSRHPVIMGLRNILKTCISHHIQTLTFPLLLTHEMTEV